MKPAFADGSPYPKEPPKNTAEVIKLALQTSWPFTGSQEAKILVQTLVCSGGVPKRFGDGKYGAWYMADAECEIMQGNQFSIDSLKAISDKVESLTDFTLDGASVRIRGGRPFLDLAFSNWKTMEIHK